jgi:hypothetical protein
LGPSGSLSGGLDRGQQEGDQDANNGDHDQQFNERERAAASSVVP